MLLLSDLVFAETSAETETQSDNAGMSRQLLQLGWGLPTDSLGKFTFLARVDRTVLSDTLSYIPSRDHLAPGLAAQWDVHPFPRWNFSAKTGFNDLSASSWLATGSAQVSLLPYLKAGLNAGSSPLEGSETSRGVRSSKIGGALSFASEHLGIWAETGGNLDWRENGVVPQTNLSVELPRNLLAEQYAWVAKSLWGGFSLGLAVDHKASRRDMFLAVDSGGSTEDSAGTKIHFAEYPYSAPLDQWVVASIVQWAFETKLGDSHTAGFQLKGNIPLWSKIQTHWPWGGYYTDTSGFTYASYASSNAEVRNTAKIRFEFQGYWSYDETWYVVLPCAVESTPSSPRGYFGSGAWNSFELGIRIVHANRWRPQ